MKRLNARWLLTFGLTSIVVSVLLMAQFIGLWPDSRQQAMQSRATLAETVAASAVALQPSGDAALLALFDFVRERNHQVLSLALRRPDGTVGVEVGEHSAAWQAIDDARSSADQIIVPLQSGADSAGRVELRFEPLQGEALGAWLGDQRLQILVFAGLCCTVSFYWYLRRMLRHLDPSRAVPERVRAAFDTLVEGLVLTDANEFIVLANSAFADLVGRPPAELIGHRLEEFKWRTREDRAIDQADLPWRIAFGHNEALTQQHLALVDSAGLRRSFQVNCSPIPSAGGRAGGVLMSLQDVTELEQVQKALQESKTAADAANRAKSEFLANMSHEIRTPMNAILGFTEVLRRGMQRGDGDSTRHLETIHRNGRNLLELINDILDLSKVESGHLQIERIDCEPHRIVAEVVEVLAVRAQDKGIALRMHTDGPVPQSLSTDATRLRQIVTNLVGNAIKFTERGEVVVTERWIADANAPRLEIAVRDSGIGVPADKAAAIFEPFVQAEGSTTRKYGGTGLGLAISRKFARAMGGDISVTSTPGRGSTFTVSLRIEDVASVSLISAQQAAASIHHSDAPTRADWRFDQSTVLVVDDSPENRELVRIVLEDAGLRVREAENGRIAVDATLAGGIDFVLMDVHMPVMDGFSAVAELRERGVTLPVVAFTADALKGFEVKIMQAGFNGYLTKPVDIEAMLTLLRGHLPSRAAARSAPAALPVAIRDAGQSGSPPEAASMAPSAFPSIITAAPLVSRLAQHARLMPVVRMFIERLPSQIDAMRRAADNGDWADVAELAHWLKGSGGSVGFDAFTDPAKKLEAQARAGATEAAAALIESIAALAGRIAPIAPAAIASTASPIPAAVAPIGDLGQTRQAEDQTAETS